MELLAAYGILSLNLKYGTREHRPKYMGEKERELWVATELVEEIHQSVSDRDGIRNGCGYVTAKRELPNMLSALWLVDELDGAMESVRERVQELGDWADARGFKYWP